MNTNHSCCGPTGDIKKQDGVTSLHQKYKNSQNKNYKKTKIIRSTTQNGKQWHKPKI